MFVVVNWRDKIHFFKVLRFKTCVRFLYLEGTFHGEEETSLLPQHVSVFAKCCRGCKSLPALRSF